MIGVGGNEGGQMAGGWIKLHRKILDSAVFSNPELLRLWIVCLMNANHRDAHVQVDGLNDPVLVKRGQFITGRFALHQDIYPRRRQQGSRAQRRAPKSPLTVWRWLETLQKLRCVDIKTNNKFTLVTVEKYCTYQELGPDSEQQLEQQTNNRRSADDQQTNTNKNEKNEKNEEEVGGVPPTTPLANGSGTAGTLSGTLFTDAAATPPQRKRKAAPGPKKPRERNPLFDAIAEVTSSDPAVAGGNIGRAAALLAQADPAYTPDEVRAWAAKIRELWQIQPTVQMVINHIGKIRSADPLAWSGLKGKVNGQQPAAKPSLRYDPARDGHA